MRSSMARFGYSHTMAASKPESERSLLLSRMENFLRERPGLGSSNFQPGEGSEIPPSLTISRQCGAGFCRIERSLLEYLDELEGSDFGSWALFDQSLLGRYIDSLPLPSCKVHFEATQAKFPILPPLQAQFSKPQEDWTLFNHSANAIRQLCQSGRCVIVGRAGNLVTCDLANTFHVRLVADKSKRIRFISRRFDLNPAEAGELVEETDKSRARFVKRNTGAEIDDATFYHLILNTESIPDEVAIRVIADSMHEWSRLRTIPADSRPCSKDHPRTGDWHAPNVIPGGF